MLNCCEIIFRILCVFTDLRPTEMFLSWNNLHASLYNTGNLSTLLLSSSSIIGEKNVSMTMGVKNWHLDHDRIIFKTEETLRLHYFHWIPLFGFKVRHKNCHDLDWIGRDFMALLSGLLASREDWEILISHLQHLHTFHEFLLRLVIILTELVTRVVQNSKWSRKRNHSSNKFLSN